MNHRTYGLLNRADLAARLNTYHSYLCELIYNGYFPKPYVPFKQGLYYHENHLDGYKAIFSKPQQQPEEQEEEQEQYLNVRQMANVLDVGENQLYHAITRKAVPGPSHRKPGLKTKRYKMEDVPTMKKAVADYEANHKAGANSFELKRRSQGYISICLAARMLGRPVITLAYWLKHGKIPKPGHKVGARYFWKLDDVKMIAERLGLSFDPECA